MIFETSIDFVERLAHGKEASGRVDGHLIAQPRLGLVGPPEDPQVMWDEWDEWDGTHPKKRRWQ